MRKVAFTENNAVTLKSTDMPTLDLFFIVGASRGKDITPLFLKAYEYNVEETIRIALWARDIRGGAGERKIFRDFFRLLEVKNLAIFKKIVEKVPLVGRWDDMLEAETDEGFGFVAKTIKKAIDEKNSLAAKWMPRKGKIAERLRKCWGYQPKQYRKYLVENTKVVETNMCSNTWEEIKFSEVPSLALARYSAAFNKHASDHFKEYLERVRRGEENINAGAIYPYNVLKTLDMQGEEVAEEQWKNLENFVGDEGILPMVDVSGSMGIGAGGGNSLSCMDIAISLGLYIAMRQKGFLNNFVMTFESKPSFVCLQEEKTLNEKVAKIRKMPWGGSTNLQLALEALFSFAEKHRAKEEEMPKTLIVFSDMEFDMNKNSFLTDYESLCLKFMATEYVPPKIVFWNLNSRNQHVPVKFDESGVILVSGFSPSLLKFILKGEVDKITPKAIMDSVIYNERYDF